MKHRPKLKPFTPNFDAGIRITEWFVLEEGVHYLKLEGYDVPTRAVPPRRRRPKPAKKDDN